MPLSRETSESEYVRGLERGFAVIKAFSAEAPALTIAETAARTGLSRAVARRYLLTLEKLGYVTRDGALFGPTPRLLDLGYSYLSTLSVADVAQPFLEQVVGLLHQSSNVAILDGWECLYVARVSARRIITTTLVVGSRVPAHATALGKVLLAHLEPAALDSYFQNVHLERYTLRTICDEARLRKALRDVRNCGWACADEEYTAGLRTIAVPIVDRSGRVNAAINVAGAVSLVSMQDMLDVYLPVLQRAARGISEALGAQIAPQPARRESGKPLPFAAAWRLPGRSA